MKAFVEMLKCCIKTIVINYIVYAFIYKSFERTPETCSRGQDRC